MRNALQITTAIADEPLIGQSLAPPKLDLIDILTLIASVVTILAFLYFLLFGQRNLTDLKNGLTTWINARRKRSSVSAGWIPPSVWIRRDSVVSELLDKLQNHRVVILEGARGVGKTSTVQSGIDEISSRLWRFGKPEAHWVQLRPGNFGGDEFFNAIAHALDFDSVAAAPEIQKAILLQRLLQTRRLLIVIDNFESVNPEHIVVRDFLGGLPSGIRCIVITSRKVVDIRGSATVKVNGFSLQETKSLVHQKFLNGELDDIPSDELLDELHKLTGGTALAIEWAVGRVKTGISLHEVISTLRRGGGDIYSRLFDTSWAILNAPERRNLVTAAMMSHPVPIGLLTSSLDQPASAVESFVRVLNMNLAMLARPEDTIDSPMLQLHPLAHTYAAIKLASTPRQAQALYVTKAASYFTELFRRVAEDGSNPSPNVVHRQILNAVSVCKLCLKWSLNTEFIQLVMAIRGSLLTSGLISERAELCQAGAEIALKLGEELELTHLKLATASGAALGLLGQHNESQKILSQAAMQAEKQGHLGQAAHTRRALAASYYRSGQTDDAIEVLAPTRQWALDVADQRVAIDIDYLLANIAYVRGEMEEAAMLCNRMILEAEPARYDRALSYAHEQLALVRLEQGRRLEAEAHAKEALRIANYHLDRRESARAELALAKVRLAGRRPLAAREMATHAAQVFAEVGLFNEEQEAHAVLSSCSGFKSIMLILIGRGPKSSSLLHLPIGGD